MQPGTQAQAGESAGGSNSSSSSSPMGRRRLSASSSTYSSSSLTGSWHRKLVFGIPLLNSLSPADNEPLPPAIDECLRYLEEKAFDTNHLFLLKDNPDKLRKAMEEENKVDLGTFSPHAISNLILFYLDTIPVPLITPDVYKTLLSCDPGMIWRIAIILEKLPPEHYNFLKRICALLLNVADNSYQNSVSVEDLVNVIEPIITRPAYVNEASDLLMNVNKSKEMVKSLILNCADIFSYSTTIPNFENGESVELRVEDVHCAHNTGNEEENWKYFNGVMWITNFQILWRSIEKENTNEARSPFVRIPHRSVSSLECFKPPGKGKSIKPSHTGVHVKCHNFRFESFLFPSHKVCKQVFEILSQFCFDTARESFAFENTETFKGQYNGWDVYTRKAEFARLGFSANWRLSTANKIYDLCDVYPKKIVIPTDIADITLVNCARNRDHSRMPIAVWRHPINFAILLRSGPTTNETAREDDAAGINLVEAVLANVKRERQAVAELAYMSCCIEVADLSNNSSASSASVYKCIQSTWFADLPSVQRLQWNFQTLQVLVMHSSCNNDQWEKQVMQSAYLNHVKTLLSAGRKLAQMLNAGTCVITQATVKDGFDLVECALVSLALLILDPFYRTIEGFIVLIEKEWNQYGFPFHAVKVADPTKYLRKAEIVPVFVLFLDCVWQIFKELPAAFEFNERFLLFLADQSIFSRFGTFLCGIDRNSILAHDPNIHMERLSFERMTKNGSISAWNYVDHHKGKFVNALFFPYCTYLTGTHVIRVHLWQAYFLRFTSCANKIDFWRQVNHLRELNGENLYLQALNLPYMLELETNAQRLFNSVRTFDLSSNYFNCYPVELLLSARLTKLNMKKNRLKSFPPSAFLSQMTSLVELVLATNQIETLPPLPQVAMFSSLTVLKLSGNKIENVESLGVLTSLTHLDLSDNCIVSVPSNLSSLQALHVLLLSNNHLSSIPENVSRLVALTELSLSKNKFSTVPSGIYHMTLLQILEIHENLIDTIGSDLLNLRNLGILNFSYNKLASFPISVCSLEKLAYLNLSGNEITIVPPNISRMTNLVHLIMEQNKILDIPLEIGSMSSLTELNLHTNELTELPPTIGRLGSLKSLELRGNPLSYLPHTIGNLTRNIEHFAVDSCSVAKLPHNVVSRGVDEILRYLQDYMQLDTICYNTKVVVVGNEDSGKTALVNSLLKKGKKSAENCNTTPTDGINLENWQFTSSKDTANVVNVHLWDLSGKEKYRTAHQLLLPQACVSIIVWDVLRGDSSEGGVDYWIRVLCARIVDAKPIIFIVATHMDHPNAPKLRKNAMLDMQNRYKEIFPSLEIYYTAVGCMNGQGISDLRKDLQLIIYQKLVANKPIPTSWQLLEKCFNKERIKRTIPLMNGMQLGMLCQACGIFTARGIRKALWWMHNNSNLCYLEAMDGPSVEHINPISMEMHGIAVLDPKWLCTSFSGIFEGRYRWAQDTNYDELGEIWKYPESDENIQQLLALAESFFLEFHTTNAQQHDVIF